MPFQDLLVKRSSKVRGALGGPTNRGEGGESVSPFEKGGSLLGGVNMLNYGKTE